MLYLIAAYWPFLLIAVLCGAVVGWWSQHARRADEITAWLENGPGQP